MACSKIEVKIAYEQIGESHVLFHFFGSNRDNHWMLVDLERYAKWSGKSVEQLLENLKKSMNGRK